MFSHSENNRSVKYLRMEISEEQYARIKDSLPVRGNVSLTKPQVLNGILCVAVQGCKVCRNASAAGKRSIGA